MAAFRNATTQNVCIKLALHRASNVNGGLFYNTSLGDNALIKIREIAHCSPSFLLIIFLSVLARVSIAHLAAIKSRKGKHPISSKMQAYLRCVLKAQ